MGLRIVGTYEFKMIGDGVTKENLIAIRNLIPPAPIKPEFIPSGIKGATATGGNVTATATLEGEYVRLSFNNPPSANQIISVSIDALFGVDRL